MSEEARRRARVEENTLRDALVERYRRERSKMYGQFFSKLAWLILCFLFVGEWTRWQYGGGAWWQSLFTIFAMGYMSCVIVFSGPLRDKLMGAMPYVFGVVLGLSWGGMIWEGNRHAPRSILSVLSTMTAIPSVFGLFFLSSQHKRALRNSLVFLAICVGMAVVISRNAVLGPVTYQMLGVSMLLGFTPLLLLFFFISRLSFRLQEMIGVREHQYRTLLQYSSDLVSILDEEGGVLYESPAVSKILGYPVESRIHHNMLDELHPDDRERIRAVYRALLARPGHVAVEEARFRHCKGHWVEMECVAENLFADPKIRGMLVNTRDVTRRKQQETRAEYLSRHDVLTSLPNRQTFLHHLGEALDHAQAEGECLALLLVDLDRFKAINETYGPRCGDILLQEVARRLRSMAGDGAMLSRLSGDEFVLMLQGTWQREEITALVQRILAGLSEPFALQNNHVRITASIGIALSPDDGRRPEQLLLYIDQAMLEAKKHQRGYQFFSSEIRRQLNARILMEVELQQAIERREFILHYQPRVDLKTGRLHSLEALVRWQHPTKGILAPNIFIPLAEETGLIHALGDQIFELACEQLKHWSLAGYQMRVAVNLSARQLQDVGLVGRINETMKQYGVDGQALELEITESAAMLNIDETALTLKQLKDSGIALSIDDFGTAYSSLNYLKRLPVDHLKIDRSFVKDLGRTPLQAPQDVAIIKAIIEISRSLGLSVIAEGIEYEEQARFLFQLQCDTGQGFFFGAPLSSYEVELLFDKSSLWQAPILELQ
ncbi:MAG: EAL domain-containing protein [Myxococcales bacterium]|nr:EAL domain-containing protein [Myxococcales bacterium]MCB9643959.1 EAL domain-containing protein [Myxococcales bacterium]